MTEPLSIPRDRLQALSERLRRIRPTPMLAPLTPSLVMPSPVTPTVVTPSPVTPTVVTPSPVLMPTPDLVLVSCSDEKLDTRGVPLPASQVYASRLFRLSLAYARTLAPDVRIRIVSAAHHALGVDELIASYDYRLSNLSLREREQWGSRVAYGLRDEFGPGCHVVVLAGADYVRAIMDGAVGCEWTFHLPFGAQRGERLPIGRRLQWLQRQIDAAGAREQAPDEELANVVAFLHARADEEATRPAHRPAAYPRPVEIGRVLHEAASLIQERRFDTYAAIAHVRDLAASTSPLWSRRLDAVVRDLERGKHRGAKLLPAKEITAASAAEMEWQCAVCGFRAAEKVVHRGATGLQDCLGKKWLRVPVERTSPTSAELVDRPLSPKQVEALRRIENGELGSDRARRRAADDLAAMRVALRTLRDHWHDVLEHDGMARVVDAESARAHQQTVDTARARAANVIGQLRDRLRAVEEQIEDATIADDAQAIAAWNRASTNARKAKLRQYRPPRPPEIVDAELVRQARAIVAEAEAGPSQHLQIEAAIVVRNRTAHGESPGRWERSAARANARRERESPLFAQTDFIARVTPAERREQIVGANLAIVEEERRRDEARQAQVDQYRALVAAVVSAEQLAELEARRGKLPASLEYALDFWHSEARARGLVDEAPIWAEVRALEEQHRAQAAREAEERAAQRPLFDAEKAR